MAHKNTEWKISEGLTPYEMAVSEMEERVAGIMSGSTPELVWLVEHPALYTAGTSANDDDLINTLFPVHESGRGGQYTYHGPGQRIAYVMLDLKKRGMMDVRRYVASLEQWIIASLAEFGVKSFTREGRVGVWTLDASVEEAKIAALGIRVRKWVTYHGIAINVNPNLSHYAGIVPCGIAEYGVTSLEKLGVKVSMQELDAVLKKEFVKIF